MRIAILEDNASTCNELARISEEDGHEARQFRDAKSLLRGLRQDSFDLLLLDWTLPNSSGLEVLSWMKGHLDPAPPTIMITARIGEADVVAGLTSGADDYLTKPLNDDVLKARINALLRRVYGGRAKHGVECFGQHAFDLQQRIVTVAGVEVATTAKEFDLALLLFRNLHRPLSRDYIVETVWEHAPKVMSRTLDAHVSQIRKGLGLKPENGLRLSSVYSFGYRLEQIELAATPIVPESVASLAAKSLCMSLSRRPDMGRPASCGSNRPRRVQASVGVTSPFSNAHASQGLCR